MDIGQRISTAIALIAAEELDVDFHRIETADADTDTSPDVGYTSASDSLQISGQSIRLAAATARRHLLELAARTLGVFRDYRRADPLAGDQPFHDLLPAAEYVQIGRRITPLGLAELVNGSARFVHDMTMPGMLHARVVRPTPHYHARLTGLDDSINERLDGGHLVRDGSFLAVAAEDEFLAVKLVARVASAVDWEPDRGLQTGDLYERLRNNPRVSLPVRDGDAVEEPVPTLAAPPDDARTTLEACFERPYLMHASIGPSAALALYESGKLTIWTHTQGVHPLRVTIAETLGMDRADVRLVHARGAGCYGHNGADDAALDAAVVARALPGRPVLLKWSREDEHAWEPYGPCMVVEIRASIDNQGRVVDWSHETYSDTHRTRPRSGPEPCRAGALAGEPIPERSCPARASGTVSFRALGGHPSKRRSLLHLSETPHRQALGSGDATAHLDPAHPGRLHQRAGHRVYGGRAGHGREGRSSGFSSETSR